MSGIILTKESPVVDLRKSESAVSDGEVVIRTTWDRVPEGLDLDQGILWESISGKKGCVQALGGNFGSRLMLPYMKLDGDDRQGGQGETIRGSYAKMLKKLNRVGLFLYIYNQDQPLSNVQGAITTVEVPGFQPITVTHDAQTTRACAILQLTNTGEGFRIKRDMFSVPTQQGVQEMIDRYWGFGLPWAPASK